MRERDVIIVGAGPAGAATAAFLAKNGYDVLLLDRQQFPRDKTCGDAVPAGAIELIQSLGGSDRIEQAVSRGELYPVHQMLLVSPRGHELTAPFTKGKHGTDSYISPRIHFDALIQQQAVACGATFVQADVKEPVVENGRVVGINARVDGTIESCRAKVVVGADGVTSVITRSLRPANNKHKDIHRAVALRAYIDDIEEIPNTVEFYLYKKILPGYAWIFPIGGNSANIGLGMRLDHFRKIKGNLRGMLDDFLTFPTIKNRLPNGVKLRDVATWQLNFGSQRKLQHVFNGAILVGDAAGFINPLTGGGIHNALISAKLAAQTIDEAFANGDTSREGMKIYEKRCDDEMRDSMIRSYLMQRSFGYFPYIVDFLVTRMRENSQLAQTFLAKL